MPKINQEEYEILKRLDDKWRWIARDSCDNHDGNLFVYPEKPFKNHYSGGWVCGIWIHPINTHLFQFIQWENDEPWNIQELIEGYEDESEEAEVKNIEWAIKEIEGLETEPSQNYPHDEVIEREIVLGILSQLDETETLSEYWIEEKSIDTHVDTLSGDVQVTLRLNDLQNLLLPEKELPVIPKFVADWIEFKKKSRIPYENVLQAIDELVNSSTSKAHDWVLKTSENKDTFARAWLDGFTVEEEQKYYALIKGHENIGSDDKYWNYCITDESLDIGDNKVHTDVLAEYVLSATKDEWGNLGVSDDNADFVKVEELEKNGKG